jgi:hypothetical protein
MIFYDNKSLFYKIFSLENFNNNSIKIDISMDSTTMQKIENNGSVMLFCNPNAGFYEYFYYDVIITK